MKLTRLSLFVKDHIVAISSFLLIFLLTLFIYSETRQKAIERNQKLFNLKADQARVAIEQRLRDYIQILIGAKALYIASDTVERKAWHEYYKTLNLEQNYPGIQGIGYSLVISPDQLENHTQKIRKEGFRDYKLYPEGKRPVYTSIIFLEPFRDRNLRAFGYDMFSEPTRQSAMRIARDTKQPAMTGKVRLVQETGKDEQAGFLIYLPVYKNNADPETIQERQKLIKGFVYSPFRAKDLMTSILQDGFDDLNIEVYDGTIPTEESLLYASDSVLHYDKAEAFDELKIISLGNHTWRVYLSARPSFGKSADTELPYFILVGGFIISLLMSFIIWSLTNTRRSNRLKQTITDNATAALFMMDANGYCTFMNPAAEEMTGYTLEELRQKPLHDLIHYKHPDGTPYPMQKCPIVKALSANKGMRAHEDVFVKKNGTLFNVTCAAQPIKENGRPAATILEVRDITDEKRAQQALIESEARFRTMADSAPVMVWMTDAWKQLVYVNDQWAAFTGQSFEKSITTGWHHLIEKADLSNFEELFEKSVAEAVPFKYEMRLLRQDNVYRWVVNTATPRFGVEGEYLGHIGSVIDITEIKEAEQKVKQNAELLQKLFLEVPALVGLVRAPDYEYVLVNPLYRKVYGDRQLVGKTIYEAHSNWEGKSFFKRLEQVFKTGEPFVGEEMPTTIDRNNNGTPIHGYFNLVYQPLMYSNGNVEAVLMFAVEVTELVNARKKLASINEELSEKNKQLLRINNDLDNFVYTASHDLKSPIANMEGLAALLHDTLIGKLNAEDEKVLDMLGESINKLKQTIADLAEITKVQKELNASVEPLYFDKILKDVTTDITGLIQDSGAVISTDFKVKEVLYARKNLRSIIYNLLSNAIKYRSSQRTVVVDVHTYREGDYIVLQVSDNGLGIKKEQQNKLFTMFKRLHSHVEGTGIGLYIVKRIIENNGGRIEVESELGEGTTFKVYFKQEPIEVSA